MPLGWLWNYTGYQSVFDCWRKMMMTMMVVMTIILMMVVMMILYRGKKLHIQDPCNTCFFIGYWSSLSISLSLSLKKSWLNWHFCNTHHFIIQNLKVWPWHLFYLASFNVLVQVKLGDLSLHYEPFAWMWIYKEIKESSLQTLPNCSVTPWFPRVEKTGCFIHCWESQVLPGLSYPCSPSPVTHCLSSIHDSGTRSCSKEGLSSEM